MKAVGIGEKINMDELRGIASPPQDLQTVFTVDKFAELTDILRDLEPCVALTTPTTLFTTTPTTPTTTSTTTTTTTAATTTTELYFSPAGQ